jgi:hypothetical protein
MKASDFHNHREMEMDGDYDLSENQIQFCKDAEDQDIDIDCSYSGRGMYGRQCPAVRLDRPNDIATRASVQTDGMGLGVVVYAQS